MTQPVELNFVDSAKVFENYKILKSSEEDREEEGEKECL